MKRWKVSANKCPGSCGRDAQKCGPHSTSTGHTLQCYPYDSNIQFVDFVCCPEVEEEFCSWAQLTSRGATNRILSKDGGTACLRNTVIHFQHYNHFMADKIKTIALCDAILSTVRYPVDSIWLRVRS